MLLQGKGGHLFVREGDGAARRARKQWGKKEAKVGLLLRLQSERRRAQQRVRAVIDNESGSLVQAVAEAHLNLHSFSNDGFDAELCDRGRCLYLHLDRIPDVMPCSQSLANISGEDLAYVCFVGAREDVRMQPHTRCHCRPSRSDARSSIMSTRATSWSSACKLARAFLFMVTLTVTRGPGLSAPHDTLT